MALTEQQIANDLREIITYHQKAIEKAEILLNKLNKKPRVKKVSYVEEFANKVFAKRYNN